MEVVGLVRFHASGAPLVSLMGTRTNEAVGLVASRKIPQNVSKEIRYFMVVLSG